MPALKLWFVFAFAFCVLKTIEVVSGKLLRSGSFFKRLFIHSIIIIGLLSLVSPIVDVAVYSDMPRVIVVPLALLLLQIVLYVTALHIYEQQQKAFETQLIVKESELNALRAQSNPHFLFNTLNLITSEIIEDPDNAVEIVYDLSDLLRTNIALSTQSFTSVSEEFNLITLFLTLQQKRFKDRLEYAVDTGEGTQNVKIPALLLQPAIENAIKHAVAPYPGSASIQVTSTINDGKLIIEVHDSGPAFEDDRIIEHEGFRILRKTLALHYPDNHHLSLKSSEHGGVLRIIMPAEVYSLDQLDED